jgi:predicted DNA-binding transcriptional regulator AlpA
MIGSAEVRRRLGDVSRVTIWRMVGDGEFPAPIRMRGRIYWLEREVTGWIAERRRQRDAAVGALNPMNQ